MYQIDFNKLEVVHFTGIGGISMSGLVEILMEEGFRMSGSDLQKSELTEQLEARGAKVFYGQWASNVENGTDMAVYMAVVYPDNPEFMAVQEKGIPMLTRAELLGQIMKNYKYAIGIVGTHGKTITISMVTETLLAADTDPTISVGGILNSIGGNIRMGDSELFVTETYEYTNSFLLFFPTMEVILSIEEDHLDFFKGIHDIRNPFRQFAKKLPEDGLLVISSDIDNYREITDDLACQVMTCGSQLSSDCPTDNITYDEFARPTSDSMIGGEKAGRIRLGVLGEHNVYNALVAIALCWKLDVSMENIREGSLRFIGTDRCFEKKGELAGITITDDYTHHPREIAATLAAVRNYSYNKTWCVFQPHTYTRTKAFLDQFAEVLSMMDEVILTDIYAARETDNLGISFGDIAERIKKLGTKAHYLRSFDDIEIFILENCTRGDLLIITNAGDIMKVGKKLIGIWLSTLSTQLSTFYVNMLRGFSNLHNKVSHNSTTRGSIRDSTHSDRLHTIIYTGYPHYPHYSQ